MSQQRRRPVLRAAAAATLALTSLAALPAGARESTGPRAETGRSAADSLRVSDQEGRLRLLAAHAGKRLAAAPDTLRDPADAGLWHARRQASRFGLARVSELRSVSVSPAPSGDSVVRVQQVVEGVPVVGGQLVVVVDEAGSLLSVSGEVTRAVSSGTYVLPASHAADVARRASARHHGLTTSAMRAVRPTRALYDATLLDPGGLPGARAVWQVEVVAPGRLDVRDRVLVDAETGEVLLRVDRVARVLDRAVCDHAGLSKTDEVCRPGDYDRVEGQAPTGVTDVDQAYDLMGVTANWWATRFSVDLTDMIGTDLGDGRKLRSTTRYCGPEGCPLDNAFWTGDQLVFGAGFTSADDVVAHEMTHGVIEHTAGLVYWFQSGAINESMSDVFGELIDLGDGVGNDAPEVRWQLGEDLPPAAGGVARDMADPTAHDQPDHTGSDLYDFAPDYDDNGAVHTNSGVGNKTAYLIADGTTTEPGGAFNGQAFGGIGVDKTALVHWAALQLLTPGSDFVDLGAALRQGCANLAAAAVGGVVAADCDVVAAAVTATGLARWTGPSEPRDVRMTTGIRSVRVRWSAPASSGSSPLSSFVLWVRPALGVDPFVPLEPGARAHLVEGLRPGVDYTIGVAAVTADGTSPSVTRTLTGTELLMRWPEPVAVGDRLEVHGVLGNAAGVGMGGRTVRLLRRYPGEPSYTEVDTATTGSRGGFLLNSLPRRGGSYVVEYSGRTAVLGDQTRPHEIALRQRVTVVADESLRRSEQPRFRGLVSPARPGALVVLQRERSDGTWRNVARGRLDGASRYDLTAPADVRRDGVWRVRVSRPPVGGLAAGLSREITVTVR